MSRTSTLSAMIAATMMLALSSGAPTASAAGASQVIKKLMGSSKSSARYARESAKRAGNNALYLAGQCKRNPAKCALVGGGTVYYGTSGGAQAKEPLDLRRKR